jgi:hypothetical protein
LYDLGLPGQILGKMLDHHPVADRINSSQYQIVAGRIQAGCLDVEYGGFQPRKITIAFHVFILPY